jgi:hypothetical protein
MTVNNQSTLISINHFFANGSFETESDHESSATTTVVDSVEIFMMVLELVNVVTRRQHGRLTSKPIDVEAYAVTDTATEVAS